MYKKAVSQVYSSQLRSTNMTYFQGILLFAAVFVTACTSGFVAMHAHYNYIFWIIIKELKQDARTMMVEAPVYVCTKI